MFSYLMYVYHLSFIWCSLQLDVRTWRYQSCRSSWGTWCSIWRRSSRSSTFPQRPAARSRRDRSTSGPARQKGPEQSPPRAGAGGAGAGRGSRRQLNLLEHARIYRRLSEWTHGWALSFCERLLHLWCSLERGKMTHLLEERLHIYIYLPHSPSKLNVASTERECGRMTRSLKRLLRAFHIY